jgi:hypothetical protein
VLLASSSRMSLLMPDTPIRPERRWSKSSFCSGQSLFTHQIKHEIELDEPELSMSMSMSMRSFMAPGAGKSAAGKSLAPYYACHLRRLRRAKVAPDYDAAVRAKRLVYNSFSPF